MCETRPPKNIPLLGSCTRFRDGKPCIQAPANAIQLQIRGKDLHLRCDGEEVEALDFVGHRADAVEVPVPEGFGAARNMDFESVDERGWWSG